MERIQFENYKDKIITAAQAALLFKDGMTIGSRRLAPRERAKVIIENCAHLDYREALKSYFILVCERGGQTPHLLEEALSWHKHFVNYNTMKKTTNWKEYKFYNSNPKSLKHIKYCFRDFFVSIS